MIFRQLFDPETSTYTYLLADAETHEAVIIDSVIEQVERDLKLIQELGLKLKAALDTHVHADHVTGAGTLRERTGCQTAVSGEGGAACADIQLHEGDVVPFGRYKVEAYSTPGHTNGCMTFKVEDMLFTGDALLIRGTGRTDFQQGDSGKLFDSIQSRIFVHPDTTRIFPGHDYRGLTQSTVGEEKRFNARLANKTREEFIEIMSNLKLAHPKKIHEAVPANLLCGVKSREAGIGEQLGKEGTTRPEGYVDVMPETLNKFVGKIRIIDVREPAEFTAELGHIKSAELVPVGTLLQSASTWKRAEPVALICRTGRRSINGGIELKKLGFETVFNLCGGMVAWNAAGLPVEGANR